MAKKRNEAPNYNPRICEIDHAGEVPQELIESLPMTEAHPFRHRCSACAYKAGLNEAAEDIEQLVEQVKALTQENEKLRAELGPKSYAAGGVLPQASADTRPLTRIG